MTQTDPVDNPRDLNANAWRKWVRRSVLTVAVLLAFYLCGTLWLGWDEIDKALDRLSHSDTVAKVLGLVVVGVALRAARWHYYVRHLGWRVGVVPSVIAFIASFALTATPGKAGELVKSALLRMRYDVSISNSAGVLLTERLTDTVAVAVLAIGGFALFSGLQHFIIVAVVLVGASVFVLSTPRIYKSVLMWLCRFRWLGKIAHKILNLLDTTRTLLRPRPLLLGTTLAIVAWGCEALALFVLTSSLIPDLTASIWIYFSIFGLATLVGALSMIPGGVGGVEATMLFLFVKIGADSQSASAVVLLFRLSTLWLFSVVGLAAMLMWVGLYLRKDAVQVTGSAS